MAPSAKQSGQATVTTSQAKSATAASNGVIKEPPASAVNRKKAKRRQKEKARREAAAQQQAADDYESDGLDDPNLAPPGGYPDVADNQQSPPAQYDSRYAGQVSQPEGHNGAPYPYSDDENQYNYDPAYASTNGVDDDGTAPLHGRKGKKKKRKGKTSEYDAAYEEQPSTDYYDVGASRHRGPHMISEDALRTVEQKVNEDAWETSTREERERIRQFWTALPEIERRDLVKIEKDAVLKKMKEQQKHSCSCTVCGRKRTAIEEELEILYDAYYHELEHYANTGERPPPSLQPHHLGTLPQKPSFSHTKQPSKGRIQELPDDEAEEFEDPEDELDEDGYDPDDYSEDEYPSGEVFDAGTLHGSDFFTFGKNLTVKGGILTVADDLLSNHGEKFIDMMEQLANARMRRETEAYNSYRNSHVSHDLHGNHYPEDDEYDDEDEYEDDESQLDDYEEDDEMDALTERQRMDEGRRMFQIFAARMFEQRVLGAYRDDVSKKKADQLIAEEEAEKQGGAQREAKKAREAEKKKAKKQQKKQLEAEKKQRKEAERAEAERVAKEAEEKRQEELRQKREEQRKKREAEKKAQEEERRRKEEEKRRLQEDAKAKQQERERQAREQKAAEKRRKEEERKKQQEEKESKAAAARERKAQQDRDQREKDEKARLETETLERKRREEESQRKQTFQSEVNRKGPPAVALPPTLKQQKSHTGSQPSPQTKVTTPAIPKAPTPQQRQASGPASQTSSSQEQDTAHGSKQSTPPTAPGPSAAHPTSAGSTRAPSRQPQQNFPTQMTSPHPVGPPPGMPFPPQASFPGMPPHAMNGFPPGPGMPGMHPGFGPNRGGVATGPQYNMPFRGPAPQNPHYNPAVPQPPPGMMGRGFNQESPMIGSHYGPHKAFAGPGPRPPQVSPRDPVGSHSRQPSASFETSPDNPNAPHPIGRPQPIQRPDSTKPDQINSKNRTQSMPHGSNEESDAHLGSSALLGDSEPSQDTIERRQTAPHVSSARTPVLAQHNTAFGHDPPQIFGARAAPGFTSPSTGASAGWGGWTGSTAFSAAAPQRHGTRHMAVRRRACDAFMKSQHSSNGDALLEMSEILNHVNETRAPGEPIVQMSELEVLLETEGDSSNGGGMFRETSVGNRKMITYIRDGPQSSIGPSRPNAFGTGGSMSPASGPGQIGASLLTGRTSGSPT